jgi:hypothetical protein
MVPVRRYLAVGWAPFFTRISGVLGAHLTKNIGHEAVARLIQKSIAAFGDKIAVPCGKLLRVGMDRSGYVSHPI